MALKLDPAAEYIALLSFTTLAELKRHYPDMVLITEAEIRGSPAEERLAVRKEQTVPLMQSLYDWIQGQMKALSRHSDTARAFACLLKQWDALNLYSTTAGLRLTTTSRRTRCVALPWAEKTGCSLVLMREGGRQQCCTR